MGRSDLLSLQCSRHRHSSAHQHNGPHRGQPVDTCIGPIELKWFVGLGFRMSTEYLVVYIELSLLSTLVSAVRACRCVGVSLCLWKMEMKQLIVADSCGVNRVYWKQLPILGAISGDLHQDFSSAINYSVKKGLHCFPSFCALTHVWSLKKSEISKTWIILFVNNYGILQGQVIKNKKN